MLGKVLLLEDWPLIYTLTHALHDCWNYSVMRVSDPRVALRGATLWQPDVVVAEAFEIDGLWLCAELKKLRPTRQIPVIIISHKKDDISEVEMWKYFATRYGVDEYLAKPFTIDRLVQMILWCQFQVKHNPEAIKPNPDQPLWVHIKKAPD